jgi:hypothetical protein
VHFHANPINLRDSAMSSAQAAENTLSVKRAKELRDAAAKLKASALDYGTDTVTDQESAAMLSAWAGNQGQNQPHSLPSTPEEDKSLAIEPIQGVSFWA